MDYRKQWNDMKKWLKEGIDYCDKASFESSDLFESTRLNIKASSLRLVLQHMIETEKIYQNLAVSEF